MIAKGTQPTVKLPRWVMVLANVAIVFHLTALAVLALSAPSGPWPVSNTSSTALPPQFASSISQYTTNYYLRHLAMVSNYHFDSNRTNYHTVRLEIRFLDEKGNVEKTLQIPDPKANMWLRNRQKVLAQNIGNDAPVPLPPGEAIPAPGQDVPTLSFFYPSQPIIKDDQTIREDKLELFQAQMHLIPRDRPVLFQPTDWSLMLAQSYVRYLKRQHTDARLEFVRRSREPLMPALMFPHPFIPNKLLVDQTEAFEEMICSFGTGEPKKWRAK